MVAIVLQSVRGISHQMMPIALQRFGLVKAVESLVDFMNNKGAIAYTFESFNLGKNDMNEDIEVHLYRIAQELSTNINKHSKATKANIQLYKQGQLILMTVSDNGIGFSKDSYTPGMGMMNIHTRVTSMAGELNVDSTSGETSVIVKIPFDGVSAI
jgi:signal transduction histidine kinase